VTYHRIQFLLYVFALFNLVSCAHQSAIKPSTAHIDESPSSSHATLPGSTIINTENVAPSSLDSPHLVS
jgi:hypothetical protein